MNVRQHWGVSGALERGRPGRSSRGKRRATHRATRRIWPNANDVRSQRAATSGKDGCVVRSRQRRGVSRQITDEIWAWKASRTHLAVGGQGVRLDDRGRVGGHDAEGGDRGDAKHRDRRASLCDEPSCSRKNAFFRQRKMRSIYVFKPTLLSHRLHTIRVRQRKMRSTCLFKPTLLSHRLRIIQ